MTDSQKLDLILAELQGVKGDVSVLKEDVSGLKGDVSVLKEDVSKLKDDVQRLDRKVSGIEIHLENVTDRNIRLVAESHLDLSRKLDEALKVEEARVLYYTRTNLLEDEIRKIKEGLAATA